MPRPNANRGRKAARAGPRPWRWRRRYRAACARAVSRLRRRSVYDTAQLTGGVRVKVAERQLKQMLARSLADIGRAAKRGQVCAHEPHEINHDAHQGKTDGPPTIHRDIAGFAPVRCHAIRSRATSQMHTYGPKLSSCESAERAMPKYVRNLRSPAYASSSPIPPPSFLIPLP